MQTDELALRVRALHTRLPVVLASGYAKELQRALQAGFEVVAKPAPVQNFV